MRRACCAMLVALGLGSVFSAYAYAGGSTASLPVPDPSAANLTLDGISQRALEACIPTQAYLLETTPAAVSTGCQCYAKATTKAMSDEELTAFRATGYFNDSARAKALASIDQCKLKRPI